MARSEEAIRRRAEKRNKTVAEQRRADFTDAKKGKERQAAKEAKARGAAAAVPIAAPETAATTKTKPPKDGNAANPVKRTVTPPRKKTKKSAKHKIKRSGAGNNKNQQPAPAAKWAKQATQDQIERNAQLRKQYLETKGEGMNEEDVQRAKALILRDERKKAKKAERAKMKVENAAAAKKKKKKKKDESSTSAIAEKKKHNCSQEKAESVDAKIEQKDNEPLPNSTATSTQPRPKKPTPLDLAWRQVAIDEKEGRIPEYVAETEAEKKLERIAERNRKSRAELAKIRTLLAGDSKDIDAGLEAVGRYAASALSSRNESSASSDGENSGIQASLSDVSSAMKKILTKNEKKAHKKAMKYKKLTKKVRKRLNISDDKKDDLKQILKRITKESNEFKLDGKVISLK